MRAAVVGIVLGCLAGAVAACGNRATRDVAPADAGSSSVEPLTTLRTFEEEARRGFDFARPPSAEIGLGPDPWALRRVGVGDRFVGILRGRSAVVLLDERLHELARVHAPRSPAGLAVTASGEILVVGEASPILARYAINDGSLSLVAETPIAGASGLRDVAAGSDATFVLDERGGRIIRVGRDGRQTTTPAGHGPVELRLAGPHVVVDALLDHEIVVVPTEVPRSAGADEVARSAERTSADPIVRIKHDGPFWGFDARVVGSDLFIAAGGVEDHVLDRRQGFFGYVDSFVYVYRVRRGKAERICAVNTSEHGVVVPKAVAILAPKSTPVGSSTANAPLEIMVTAYGSARRLTLRVPGADPGSAKPVDVEAADFVPGVRELEAGERTVMADPLLDAWISLEHGEPVIVPVPEDAKDEKGNAPKVPERSAASRLGEALFFTTLMAPKNESTGPLSRFTCETCHFEGYGDGRVHHTGREEIHATTKPLVGLVGNRPHFSRALDPDLSAVAINEFRVAGAGNPHDPFFSLDPGDAPWLRALGIDAKVEALDQRRALMRFLMDFSHRPNPAAVGRKTFTDSERAGASLFRERCESCHAARLAADDPATVIPFDRWEAMILDDAAPIVWGSVGYQKTGVLPYVHPDGARTPSLRRLYKKFPYFTNGSAASIADVLARAREAGGAFFHEGAPDGAERLDAPTQRALLAFLELL